MSLYSLSCSFASISFLANSDAKTVVENSKKNFFLGISDENISSRNNFEVSVRLLVAIE